MTLNWEGSEDDQAGIKLACRKAREPGEAPGGWLGLFPGFYWAAPL